MENYIKNIKYLLKLEKTIYWPPINYTTIKDKLTEFQRRLLIEWLYEIHIVLNLQFSTLNLAIIILDVYASLTNITKNKIQAIGCMCLDIASSITELWPLDIADIVYLTDGAFTRKQFVKTRFNIIDVLDGNFIRPTQYYFVTGWLVNRLNLNKKQFNSDYCNGLIFLSLYIPNLITYKSSSIANALYFLLTGEVHRKMTSKVTIICNLLHETLAKITPSDKGGLPKIVKEKLLEFRTHMSKECPQFSIPESQIQNLNSQKKSGKILTTPSLKEKLGEGTFAEVFKYQSNDKNFAVKYYKLGEQTAISADIINEISILNLLSYTASKKHCPVVVLEEIKMHNKKGDLGIFLFFELASMNLYDYRQSQHYDNKKIITMFKQIVEGVNCLHIHDIIHGDLKPQNIIWFNDNTPLKIIDIGSSISYASFRKGRTENFTTSIYRAPEVFLNDQYYGYKVDMWSIGLVLYYIITGQQLLLLTYTAETLLIPIFETFGVPNDELWPGVTSLSGWSNIYNNLKLNTKSHDEIIKGFGEYYNLAKPCLQVVPTKRVSSEKLLKCINKIS